MTVGEEIANGVSHGIGVVLSIAGLGVLVTSAALRGGVWHVATSAVFGTTLILLYLASTIYHSVPIVSAKRVLRVLDHSAIYLLIAGTYTPFTLVTLRGPWGWTLFTLVWVSAVAGIVFKSVAIGRARILSVVLYVVMGWCVLLALRPLLAALAPGGVALLFGGGVAYTLGLVFYGRHSLRYHHFLWHLFVLLGSVLHYFAVLFYVIPRR